MATNQYSQGLTAQHTAGSDIASGDVVVLTDRIGVAVADIDAGDTGTVDLHRAHTLAKTTGTAWTVGQRLWWNSTTSKCITTPTGIFAGFALVAAASGDTTGVVALGGPAPSNPLLETTETLTIRDDDNAASTGVALKVIYGPDGNLELMSEHAGNADVLFKSTNGLGTVLVKDSTAALGVALYFDEDGAPGERLLAALQGGADAYLKFSDGRVYKVKYHASPGTPGVALYFDDDAANVAQRILFVSPTNAHGTVTSETTVSGLAAVV